MWVIGRKDLCVKTNFTDVVFLPKQAKNQKKLKGYKKTFGGDGNVYYFNYGDGNTVNNYVQTH